MPKVAILFFILLFFPMITNSHAFIPVDLKTENDVKIPLTFKSDIIDVDSNFFTENNLGYCAGSSWPLQQRQGRWCKGSR